MSHRGLPWGGGDRWGRTLLSLGHLNAQKSLASMLEGLLGNHLAQSPHSTNGKLRHRQVHLPKKHS